MHERYTVLWKVGGGYYEHCGGIWRDFIPANDHFEAGKAEGKKGILIQIYDEA